MERYKPAPIEQAVVRRIRQAIQPYAPPTREYLKHTAPTYATGMGRVTFEQLYQQTSRIVGFVMRESWGMTNPEDIDDCMQAGYLKVWRQLQQQPDLFADKPKTYIVKAVVFRAKAQRYSHLRHYRKLIYDAPVAGLSTINHPTPDQIDTWIDLQQALTCVANVVVGDATLVNLVALYTLITSVKTQEVIRLFGWGKGSLTRPKRRLRSALACQLCGYGGVATSVATDKTQNGIHKVNKSVAVLLFDL